MMPEMASREPPVGSSDSDSYHDTIVLNQPKSDPDQYRVKQLEEERDNLQKNMISLTSRLAQVKSNSVSPGPMTNINPFMTLNLNIFAD